MSGDPLAVAMQDLDWLAAMQDLDWQRRARGRSGRHKPGRPSRGFLWALRHLQLREPRAFKKATPGERRKARNKLKAARQRAR